MNLESFVINANSFFAFLGPVENLLNSFCSDMFFWLIYFLHIYSSWYLGRKLCFVPLYRNTSRDNAFDRYIVFYRVYWMVCIGQGLLAVVWFGSSPTLPPLVSSTGDTQKDWEIETSCWRKRGVRGWPRSRISRPRESLVLYKSSIYSLVFYIFIYYKSTVIL
jgi:hypothetical protein